MDAIDFIKQELKHSKQISREKNLENNAFWKGRIYTLKRCIRKLNEGGKKKW
ncbi:MAG: hypothetical protein Q7S33_03900 [Nanoarchaeota archaeon]|nr:hypothetical protein [Nanoarchaeota archaeon]